MGNFEQWKCNFCGELFKGGCWEIKPFLQAHAAEKHRIEFDNIYLERHAYNKELFDFTEQLQKKYPKWNEGFCSLFTLLPTKPPKLWRCPECEREMTYHYKRSHQDNPKTQCIPFIEKSGGVLK